jgi:hypothetical protein
MNPQVINGLRCEQTLRLPDKSLIVQVDWDVQPAWSIELPCRFTNHNIFRLSKTGKVLWQVTRDEGERADWGRAREKAETGDINHAPFLSPFVALYQRLPDGTTVTDPATGSLPESSPLIDGATVICSTIDRTVYELNIETGLATNKTKSSAR